jgi:hypothetical protein
VDAAKLARELEAAIGADVLVALRAAVRATLWEAADDAGSGAGGAQHVDSLAARFGVDENVIDSVSSLVHLEMDGVIDANT